MAQSMIHSADLIGLWKRATLKMPAENPTFEDQDTAVYWFQAKGLYADLRIPKGLTTQNPNEALVGKAEGFAGLSSVSENICTWDRLINLQGPLDAEDIGALEFKDGDLHETGLDGAYLELWQKVEVRGEVLGQAFRGDDGMIAITIWSEERFLLAVDQPSRTGDEQTLRDQPSLKNVQFGTYCFGHFDGDNGVATLTNRPVLRDKVILLRPNSQVLVTMPVLNAVTQSGRWIPLNLISRP